MLRLSSEWNAARCIGSSTARRAEAQLEGLPSLKLAVTDQSKAQVQCLSPLYCSNPNMRPRRRDRLSGTPGRYVCYSRKGQVLVHS
eukprot:scaffold256173_cov22-Tisochrysis_lutea.AAC.1